MTVHNEPNWDDPDLRARVVFTPEHADRGRRDQRKAAEAQSRMEQQWLSRHDLDVIAAAIAAAREEATDAEAARWKSKIEAVLAIHINDRSGKAAPSNPGMCVVCMHEWPCPTAGALLDGDR